MERSGFILFIVFSCTVGALAEPIYNVINYGAVGDGQANDTQAFLATWNATCLDTTGNVTFLVPNGKTFLVGQVKFEGLCKSGIHVQVDGEILRPNENWGEVSYWIMFNHISGLSIDGSGKFDGRGDSYWPCKSQRQCKLAPNMLALLNIENVELSQLTFINSPQMHIVFGFSNGVVVHNVTITAPGDSPNTDGIHIQECQQVQISHSIIATGDDCISLGNGTINANVSNIICGPGHGISIGSLGENNSEVKVEEIHIRDSTLFNTTNGIRIKSWQGGSGYARGISFENINLTDVLNPIIIDQYYCPREVCQIQPSAVSISDVQYIGITGTTLSNVAISLNCSQSVACQGIVMDTVNIQLGKQMGQAASPDTSFCYNAHGIKKGIVVPDVPCLNPAVKGLHAPFSFFH